MSSIKIEYSIEYTSYFKKQYKKIIKNNVILEKRIDTALRKLGDNPELVSHKIVDTIWSCRVTGDIRILWEYKEGEITLLLLKIGGHSGGNSVY